MSGHSKWSQIKHKKALTDQKRGKLFSKLSRLITVAAKQKGGNPQTNPGLSLAIDRAKSFNMPVDNIERAIKKGTGELEGVNFEDLLIEAYGPGGVALLIEGTTDSRNRTVAEIKHLLSLHEGKLANPGSVAWLFERRGIVVAAKKTDKESLELEAIESGAEDLNWIDEESLEICTKPEELEKVKKALTEKEVAINDASLAWVAKNEVAISDPKEKERLEKLLEALDENDDVSEVYANTK